MRALDSLRFEKGYGVWSAEFAQSYTPGMSGLDRFIDFDKPDFIGRGAALQERETAPAQRLALMAIDSIDADAFGFEPIWVDGQRVGFVTSGGYGHHTGLSLALGYVDRHVVESNLPLTVHIVGAERPARVLSVLPYDPAGVKLRS
jgi:dimethylglycine dehydrogenase